MESIVEIVPFITSPDYKERLKGEYLELSIRTKKLKAILDNWDHLDFTPTCSFRVLSEQHRIMECYLKILKERMAIEGVFVKD